jgi:transposase-like protein
VHETSKRKSKNAKTFDTESFQVLGEQMETVQIQKARTRIAEEPPRAEFVSTNVICRALKTCPKCGKDGHYSAIMGYANCDTGARFFCPHCGFTSVDGGF